MQVIPKNPILGQINIGTLVHIFGTLVHILGTLVYIFGTLVHSFGNLVYFLIGERMVASAKREPHGWVKVRSEWV